MSRNKSVTLIALILLFAMAISLVALPAANAQATRATYAVIGATPNPVGVGQETLILVGITQQLTSAEMGWEDLSVTVTRPDGTTETLTGIRTDSTGLTGRVYVPTMAGNYTLQAHFPAQVTTATKSSPGTPVNTTMLASSSKKLTLVVQEEPIKHYPAHPLPTEYWTRPIDAQHREWAPIAGSWLESYPRNWYAPYNDDAPETAHILWTKPLTSGGLVGGTQASLDVAGKASEQSFEIGDAYEGKFANRFILAGKLYYDKYASPDPYHEIVCVDLRTGEQLWSRVLLNNLTITRGQLMYWDTYDYHGVYDYLWATGNAGTRALLNITAAASSWHAFDPFTGDYVYTLHSLPTATATTIGPKGEILIYTVSLTGGWVTMWNSTNIPALYASAVVGSMGWGQWRAMGKIVNATGPHGVTFGGAPFSPAHLPVANLTGYQWNKTIPTGLPGTVWAVFQQDKMVGNSMTSTAVYTWAISLKPGDEGRLLYNKTWAAPAKWLAGNLTISRGAISAIDGVCTVRSKEDNIRYGFSIETGDFLWEVELEDLDYLMGGFAGETGAIAEGKFFSGTVSGVLKCFDVKTGKLLWQYEARDPYMQALWSNNWPVCYLIITDGKIYIAHTEHSPIDPRPRGAPLICLNTTTGEVIWRANGLFRQTVWGGRAIIGDSIIVLQDTYDQRIYAIGKGPSATTVAASPKVSVHGGSVLVEGMVTDISPGTKAAGLTMRFPNGVPAVADESMSDWMLYVYKQYPRPADAKGVEVVISVLDPNGNSYEVGRTTSDPDGFFKLAFIPEVPGEYTVIAEFAGSKSYYGSFAKTAINVEDAPQPTPAPTPTPVPMSEMYFVPAIAGIIVAIAIVGVLLALLLLRKR